LGNNPWHGRSEAVASEQRWRAAAGLGTILAFLGNWSAPVRAADVPLQLRYRVETARGSGRYHTLTRTEPWNPHRTAVIVCDVWDLHHCLNAVRRVQEFAPRLNRFLQAARARGMTVIHAPSDCLPAYEKHPARLRALAVPRARDIPRDIGSWCSRIPAEERGRYPIDQSDGGEDDDPVEHRAWAEKLKSLGRNPRAPWKKQSDLLGIENGDYISDRGEEVWSILQSRGIDRVILTGVHTNMCVLGRPFGLRQMVRNGKKTVLVRDLTDTMYNPERWPHVSHFTGTDRIVAHIEKFVCPTVTSDQLLGGRPFRFQNDRRPHLALVIAEDEYQTHRTLPDFAGRLLGKDFRVSTVFDRRGDPNDLPGLEVLDGADILLLSVRRRLLKPEQLAIVRRFVQANRPVIGIRTASHAFAPPSGKVPRGHTAWPEFDREVFGGNYHGHHGGKGKEPQTFLRVAAGAERNPLLTGLRKEEFVARSWLYMTSPLEKGTTVLLLGRDAERKPEEPAAWTFLRAGGGRSFYTSLGHPSDFALADFQRLLLNAVYWSAGLPIPKEVHLQTGKHAYRSHWNRMPVPSTWAAGSHGVLAGWKGTAWYRCLLKVPAAWSGRDLTLTLPAVHGKAEVFLNGHKVAPASPNCYQIAARWVEAGELNLLSVRLASDKEGGLAAIPEVRCGKDRIGLRGDWQFRIGDNPAWSQYVLPAKFAASTDVIFEGKATQGR
jgi:nicotinamidase-related amidase